MSHTLKPAAPRSSPISQPSESTAGSPSEPVNSPPWFPARQGRRASSLLADLPGRAPLFPAMRGQQGCHSGARSLHRRLTCRGRARGRARVNPVPAVLWGDSVEAVAARCTRAATAGSCGRVAGESQQGSCGAMIACQQPSSSCGSRPSAITSLLAASILTLRWRRPFLHAL